MAMQPKRRAAAKERIVRVLEVERRDWMGSYIVKEEEDEGTGCVDKAEDIFTEETAAEV